MRVSRPTSRALWRDVSAGRWGHERGEADEVVLWVVGIVGGLLLAGMGCACMEMSYSYTYTGDPEAIDKNDKTV